MSLYFKWIIWVSLCCSALLLFSVENKDYNPVWVDSVLRHKTDSAQMHILKQTTFIDSQKDQTSVSIIQPLKNQLKTIDYTYAILILLAVLSVLYVFFGDYFVAARESLWSIKQYQVYLEANKFGNYFLLIALFLLKIVLFAFIAHTFINIYISQNYHTFDFDQFVYIFIVVALFYVLKIIAEVIVIFIIGQFKTYRVFYYNKQFFDIVFGSLFSLFIVLIYYNVILNLNTLLVVWGLFYMGYIVYKGLKIYQISKNSDKVYFILYLCTFKIMPLLLLAKYLWLNLK